MITFDIITKPDVVFFRAHGEILGDSGDTNNSRGGAYDALYLTSSP